MARFIQKNERTTFIIECFEEFYRQVLKFKKLVHTQPWKKADKGEKSSPQATAEFILSNLQNFLENQMTKSTYGGSSYAEHYYTQAQFVMVALADEVFLNLEWPGKSYWEANLLEQRLYNTHSAGEVFFENLEELLKKQNPVQTDLAIIYLNALGLGFRGKYRHFDDAGALKSYRKDLFLFVNRREPYLFQNKTHLFPDAYSHTLEGGAVKELPNLRNWYFIFASLALVYLLTSYIIWYSATAELSQIVDKILSFNLPSA